jgi:hypothetical protein
MSAKWKARPAYDDIRIAESDLEELKSRYLRARGWKHTSTTPGCYWLWEKTLVDERGVRVALVDLDTAVRLQQHLDPPDESSQEDDGG